MMADGFTILPAIDLRAGRCVRLLQGRADCETVYSGDPLEIARRWVRQGAGYLHIVDLDGAFAAAPVQRELVCRIAREVDVPVEVGGGVRTVEQVRDYLEGGLQRVIIGTSACRSPEHVRGWVREFGAALAVGIDARDGMVQVGGWTETTAMPAVELARRMDACGVATLVVTDTARDGMLTGTDREVLARVCDAVGCRVIASGGVAATDDIRALRALRRRNLDGVIVGKALYAGVVGLEELIQAAREEGRS